MSTLSGLISSLLSIVLKGCFYITQNYGLSIILFTLFTKLFLFPLSVFIQKNSIRMVQIQPHIDSLKIKYIDDKDILLLDDTISSGETVSQCINGILSNFIPKSITIITLLSKVKS